jgi:hypothetical protein
LRSHCLLGVEVALDVEADPTGDEPMEAGDVEEEDGAARGVRSGSSC